MSNWIIMSGLKQVYQEILWLHLSCSLWFRSYVPPMMLAIHVSQQTAFVFGPKGTVWALKLGLLPTFKFQMSCESSFPHVHLPTLGASKSTSSHCCMMSAISLLWSMFLSTHNINFTLQISTTRCVDDVCKHLLKDTRHPASVLKSVIIFET
jgi:hypothetical protein